MSAHDRIESFVSKVRSRLNRFRLLDSLWWMLAGVGAALLVVCLIYVLRGYAVPKLWYGVAAGLFALATLALFAIRRWSGDGAAQFADRFYDLKDSIATSRHFKKEGREGDFVELQKSTTAAKVDPLKVGAIRYEAPIKVLMTGFALMLICTLLAFKSPAAHIVEKIQIEEETAQKTDEINDYLEELIDELEKEADDEELKELDAEKLREWVKELEDTKDRKDAMRQYAQLERKLQDAARRMDQKKNEELLAKVGKEVKKDDQNKQLGKKLEEKKFQEAAEELKAMKPGQLPEKKMSEQRKELARLKSAAQRMAAAAKSANRKSATASNSNQKKNSNSSKSQNNNSANQSQSSQSSGSQSEQSGSMSESDGQLSDQLAKLDEAVKNLEEAMKNAELEKKQLGKISEKTDGDCKNCKACMLAELDKLSESLCKIGTKKDAQSKLLSMCKKLGQCQGYLGEPKFQSLAQCMGAKPGGKKAGNGSVESRTDQTSELVDNGQTTQLKGQKGQGPSLATIESADDGDGVSSRRTVTAQREFREQMESFVQREDVPEDVKEGVKQYFQSIHQSTEE